jgi:hypothetical protein
MGMSQLATKDYLLPVAAAKAGAAYNPSSDTVQFAFMPQVTQVPQSGDWKTGSWEANASSLLYPWNAVCLIGPAGTVTLGTGVYVVYVKITDSPEIPVDIVGYLEIS